MLAEGQRVPETDLVTLEPAISGNQLAEMRDAALQLVLPASLHATYPAAERVKLCDMTTFIATVQERQNSPGVVPKLPAIKVHKPRKKK